MIHYEMLLQYDPPGDLVPAFSQAGYLFNTHEHLRHQQRHGLHLLSALNVVTQQADARCAFFVQSGKAVSLFASPFGSIEWSPSFPDPYFDLFIRSLLQAARSAGADTLRLINYPLCYVTESGEFLVQKLLRHGFVVVETNQTFFLPVSDISFELGLVPAERRRISKCLNASLQFIQWPSPDKTEVINFLRETRRQKGYPLTISPERLTDLFHTFPDQCTVFAVMDGHRIAALTVTIRVRQDILYNFQPASSPAYQSFSPMVLLIKGLYGYCQQQTIKLLDLGLSLDGNNQPKPSLARFKRNLGAQESPKMVFERDLSAL